MVDSGTNNDYCISLALKCWRWQVGQAGLREVQFIGHDFEETYQRIRFTSCRNNLDDISFMGKGATRS